ncbi:MAG: VTT domain-containing protein [Myxococcota bacterium]
MSEEDLKDTGDLPVHGIAARVKFAMFAVIFALGTWAVSQHDLSLWLDYDQAHHQVAAHGWVGAALFTVLFAAATTFAVPATPLTLVGVALFDTTTAFLTIYIGALLSALSSFALARWMGRGFVEELLGRSENPVLARLDAWSTTLETRGFSATLYLRLLQIPYFIPSYLAALSRTRFRDYVAATMLSNLVNTFVFVFLGLTLQHVWASVELAALWTWRLPTAIALVVLSGLAPVVLERLRPEALSQPVHQAARAEPM